MTKCNIENRTIFCRDNIDVLRGINSNCIDLIYLDPPFNKKKVFTAPIGSSAEGASFTDIFREEDVKDEWIETIKEDNEEIHNFLDGVKKFGNKYNFCYLAYMAIRLIECHRVLKDTGSLYLHCDPTMSHYLKILLDCIFGEENFRNEIVWCYSIGGKSKKDFGKKHDIILRYSMNKDYFFCKKGASIPRKENTHMKTGIENSRKYQEKVDKRTKKVYRYYLDEGKIAEDYWIDIETLNREDKERTGYPTQKPLALLERIIKASSNKGDFVLDPFCGCATTCVASEKLSRKWIGIDVSHKAHDLVKERIAKEVEDEVDLSIGKKESHKDKTGQLFQWKHKINEIDKKFSTTPPKRTDDKAKRAIGKYVYVISHKKHKGWYKVGIAKDVQARLNSYQTSDPKREYCLEFSEVKEKFRECEKHIHNIFKNQFEWVNGDLKDIIKEIKEY